MSGQSANQEATELYHQEIGHFIRQFALADAFLTQMLLEALNLNSPEGGYLAYGMGLQVRRRKLVSLIKSERSYPRIFVTLIGALVDDVADFRDKLVHWPASIIQGRFTQYDTGRARLDGSKDQRELSVNDIQLHGAWLDYFNQDAGFALTEPRTPSANFLLYRAPLEELPQWWAAHRAKLHKPPQAPEKPAHD